MIGGKFKRSEEFLQVLEEGPKIVAGFSLCDLLPSSSWLASLIRGTTRLAERNHRKSFKLVKYVTEQLEERRDTAMAGNYDMEESEDLVDVLLTPEDTEGRLIVKETMRLHPPAPLLIPRKAMKPCKINGYNIPKGTTMLVNAWAVGRDRRHWEDPDEFKPERLEPCIIDFNDEAVFEHIPSTSILPFAHASMEIVLATLLYYFDWELPGGVEVDMTEMGLTLRQKKDLYLHAVVRGAPDLICSRTAM
ncbi:hypothetical protein ACQ4PT_018876 [Festuca glaucescens]